MWHVPGLVKLRLMPRRNPFLVCYVFSRVSEPERISMFLTINIVVTKHMMKLVDIVARAIVEFQKAWYISGTASPWKTNWSKTFLDRMVTGRSSHFLLRQKFGFFFQKIEKFGLGWEQQHNDYTNRISSGLIQQKFLHPIIEGCNEKIPW